MASLKHMLVVGGLLLALTVTATSPPHGHEATQVSIMQCPQASVMILPYIGPDPLTGLINPITMMAMLPEVPFIAPRKYEYLPYLVGNGYKAPYVKRPEAFYARSSC